MSVVIRTERLVKRFGRKDAVDGLDLEVVEGGIYAFLGPNGAGKTTTIKMFMNILRPDSGRSEILGCDSAKLSSEILRQIGYVSENQKLPEWMTVEQLSAYCRPMYPAWDAEFHEKLLRQFELPRREKIRHLSRGMKVKAALLVSLSYRPRLLVLDEPFSGLDPFVREEFIHGMLELAEQESWTVFISSHDLDEVERLADSVAIINQGRLCLAEPIARLQARFRQVDVVFDTPPASVPQGEKTWLNPGISGNTLSLVESEYREHESETRLKTIYPSARDTSFSPMTLRAIFLALARSFRVSMGGGEQ